MNEKELFSEYRNGAYTEYVSNETQKKQSFLAIIVQWSTHPKKLNLLKSDYHEKTARIAKIYDYA